MLIVSCEQQEKSVWIEYGMFYFKIKRFEAARKLMKRSFESLEKKDHLDVISKFAQMEFKMGQAEKGKSLYENILMNYPKRIDIWLIYLSMMIKCSIKSGEGDNRDAIESIRAVFERVLNMGMNMKKVNGIFKKYIEFEEMYGSESTVNRIKQMIAEYVESNKMMLP